MNEITTTDKRYTATKTNPGSWKITDNATKGCIGYFRDRKFCSTPWAFTEDEIGVLHELVKELNQQPY